MEVIILSAKGYDFFSGSQTDINRRLLRKIEALEAKVGSEGTDIGALEDDVEDIKDAIGDESTEGTILARIKALEDAE